MATPYIGEIRIFGGNFEIQGWAYCNGQLLSISQNDTLFNLIGTTYGGDGQNTFALPDLRGRVPIHQGTGTDGNSYFIGQVGGTEAVTLAVNQIPSHTHAVNSNSATAKSSDPTNNYMASQPALLQYTANGTANSNFKANAINPAGGSQPHNNMIPFVGMNYIISLFGVYPTQN